MTCGYFGPTPAGIFDTLVDTLVDKLAFLFSYSMPRLHCRCMPSPRSAAGSAVHLRHPAGRLQPDLEQLRPVLPVTNSRSVPGVVGDAVEDVRLSRDRWDPAAVRRDRSSPAPRPAVGIDARDPVGLPHVREDLALHPLQLVQFLTGVPSAVTRRRPVSFRVIGSRKRSSEVPSLMISALAVLRQRPAFAGVVEFAFRGLERGQVVDETDLRLPGQLISLPFQLTMPSPKYCGAMATSAAPRRSRAAPCGSTSGR